MKKNLNTEFDQEKYENDGFEEVLPDSKILKIGESCVGRFEELVEADDRTLALMVDEEGQKFCLPLGAVLLRKFSTLQSGDTVKVVRTEGTISKSDREVKIFKVFKKK